MNGNFVSARMFTLKPLYQVKSAFFDSVYVFVNKDILYYVKKFFFFPNPVNIFYTVYAKAKSSQTLKKSLSRLAVCDQHNTHTQ